VVFWTFGNLGGATWTEIKIIGVVFVGVFLYFMLNRWNYNAMRAGADTAKSLGIDTRSLMTVSMVVSSLAAAITVAFVGVIGFVGLVAPHMMRQLVGDDYRFLVPASAMAGALVLIFADTFARLIIDPVILPVGAVTSFLGAPLFLILLMKGAGRAHD
jgi:iron complex transport system permease protein